MSGRRWTEEEDAQLSMLVIVGVDYRSIARRLGRSMDACKSRASMRGLKKNTAAVLANRQAGRERFNRNAAKVERRSKRIKASFTPLDRAIRSEEARQRNLAGTFGVRHQTAETRQKISVALKGRIFSDETIQRMSDARKRYWDFWRGGGVSLVAYRAAMTDHDRPLPSGEAMVEQTRIWCAQCDKQVSAKVAAACASPFCKAKEMAA